MGEGKEPKYPSEKIDVMKPLAAKHAHAELADLYEWMLVREVRNAFFHSGYAINPESFIVYRDRGPTIDGIITSVVPWKWLVPSLQLTRPRGDRLAVMKRLRDYS